MCVQRNKDSKRKSLPTTLIFLLSTKEMNENLRLLPFLWARKMRITFLVTYTHEVMTDKLNGWGHTRPVQTFPLPPTVRLDTLGDFQGTLQIEVEVVKITSIQHPREGSQGANCSGLTEEVQRKTRGSAGTVRSWGISRCRWELLPNGLGSGCRKQETGV